MKNNGILVVNKPSGMTSRDVINVLNKVFNTKSIGHTGTLDPDATGILVCLIGKYTKLGNILTYHDKEYDVSFKLGILTDTLDISGKTLKTSNKVCTNKDIINTIKSYIKTYKQEVPIYSSVKVNGMKLYEYARRNIDVTLPKKDVTIYDISNISINDDISFRCRVSKGTYIRSLVRDIGNSLGVYATLTKLNRIKVGTFNISDAYTLEDISNNKYKLLDIEDVLDTISIDMDDILYKRVVNGNIVDTDIDKYIIYKYNGIKIALYYKGRLILKY